MNARYRNHNGPIYPGSNNAAAQPNINEVRYASMMSSRNQFASMPRHVTYARMPRNEMYTAQMSIPDDYSVEMPPPPPNIR